MSKAEVFTSGRASSTLDDHHIKRTRYAHQVSVVALSILMQEAYADYCAEVNGKGPADTSLSGLESSKINTPCFIIGHQ